MKATENTTELETICSACRGLRGEAEFGKFYPCDECNGAGYVPTKIGEAILDLMRHNLRSMMDSEAVR